MNKSEFIAAFAEKADITKVEANKAYESFIEVIKEQLCKGEKIQLLGFGNFEVKERGERTGKNPATGEMITIAACKAPSFKAGKAFKEMVN